MANIKETADYFEDMLSRYPDIVVDNFWSYFINQSTFKEGNITEFCNIFMDDKYEKINKSISQQLVCDTGNALSKQEKAVMLLYEYTCNHTNSANAPMQIRALLKYTADNKLVQVIKYMTQQSANIVTDNFADFALYYCRKNTDDINDDDSAVIKSYEDSLNYLYFIKNINNNSYIDDAIRNNLNTIIKNDKSSNKNNLIECLQDEKLISDLLPFDLSKCLPASLYLFKPEKLHNQNTISKAIASVCNYTRESFGSEFDTVITPVLNNVKSSSKLDKKKKIFQKSLLSIFQSSNSVFTSYFYYETIEKLNNSVISKANTEFVTKYKSYLLDPRFLIETVKSLEVTNRYEKRDNLNYLLRIILKNSDFSTMKNVESFYLSFIYYFLDNDTNWKWVTSPDTDLKYSLEIFTAIKFVNAQTGETYDNRTIVTNLFIKYNLFSSDDNVNFFAKLIHDNMTCSIWSGITAFGEINVTDLDSNLNNYYMSPCWKDLKDDGEMNHVWVNKDITDKTIVSSKLYNIRKASTTIMFYNMFKSVFSDLESKFQCFSKPHENCPAYSLNKAILSIHKYYNPFNTTKEAILLNQPYVYICLSDTIDFKRAVLFMRNDELYSSSPDFAPALYPLEGSCYGNGTTKYLITLNNVTSDNMANAFLQLYNTFAEINDAQLIKKLFIDNFSREGIHIAYATGDFKNNLAYYQQFKPYDDTDIYGFKRCYSLIFFKIETLGITISQDEKKRIMDILEAENKMAFISSSLC